MSEEILTPPLSEQIGVAASSSLSRMSPQGDLSSSWLAYWPSIHCAASASVKGTGCTLEMHRLFSATGRPRRGVRREDVEMRAAIVQDERVQVPSWEVKKWLWGGRPSLGWGSGRTVAELASRRASSQAQCQWPIFFEYHTF